MTDSSQVGLDHMVVLGASAGGLEALRDLISHLPQGGHAAYVVAQHLAPNHPSQLVELLASCTGMTVVTAADGTVLKPDQITVVPPNSDATIEGIQLRITNPEARFGPSPSIDRLFDSLAHEWGDRAVAVVLSGTGSDGACGLRSVGASGGLTLVQDPESARFDGMPRSAIAIGSVDLIADAATIGTKLCEWFNADTFSTNQKSSKTEPIQYGHIAAQLKRSTGIDFSQYKESTLRRQVHRRMAIHGLASMEDYLPVLSTDDNEAQALMHNLLVSVTSFFRDPEAFAALGQHLQVLLSHRDPNQKFRIWVPGCATGEEAYSIGMIASEALGHPPNLSQQLKIFATDLNEQSLAFARRANYPISAAKSIPEHLLLRFTEVHNNTIEISKDLRNCIVFARHNVNEDPPFPSIDLLSCRNTLIYFTAPLQERLMDLFSFSLKPGGVLFLGNSESLGSSSNFTVMNPSQRLYTRKGVGRSRARPSLTMPIQRVTPQQRPIARVAFGQEVVPEQHINLLKALIRTLAQHPCLVLDENHDLVEVIGDVSPYCRIPEGSMTAAVSALLRDELQSEARALVLLVRADHKAASSGSLQLPDLASSLRLEVVPLQAGGRSFTVLSFIPERTATAPPTRQHENSERDAAFAREIERLERELLANQDTLRRSMVDLEQANEELEASSEELQASSEELQSSNEELEASNEELQASNEELGSLNQQLRTHSEELEHLNIELENIQSSLSQGMVIVDRKLRITRFSPLAVRVFGLVDSDIGQPLIGIPTTVPLPELREALLAVLPGQERRSIEATSEEVSYLVQVMPYSDRDDHCLGAIVTLTDVSELVALRLAAEASLREFASLADALDQAVWKRDHTMQRILFMSQRIKALTGWSATELCGDPTRFDGAIHHEDQAAVMAARQGGSHGWTVHFRLNRRDGQQRILQEVATLLDESNDHCIVGTLTDVTQQRQLEQQNQLLASAYQSLVAIEAQPIALLDQDLRFLLVSESFAAAMARRPQDLQGQLLEQLEPILKLSPQPSPAPTPAQQLPADLVQLARRVVSSSHPTTGQMAVLSLGDSPGRSVELAMLPLGWHQDGQGDGQGSSQGGSQGDGSLGVLLQLQFTVQLSPSGAPSPHSPRG